MGWNMLTTQNAVVTSLWQNVFLYCNTEPGISEDLNNHIVIFFIQSRTYETACLELPRMDTRIVIDTVDNLSIIL